MHNAWWMGKDRGFRGRKGDKGAEKYEGTRRELQTKPSTLTTGTFLLMYKIKDFRNASVYHYYTNIVLMFYNRRTAISSPRSIDK